MEEEKIRECCSEYDSEVNGRMSPWIPMREIMCYKDLIFEEEVRMNPLKGLDMEDLKFTFPNSYSKINLKERLTCTI
jgi:hypothetical protein